MKTLRIELTSIHADINVKNETARVHAIPNVGLA